MEDYSYNIWEESLGKEDNNYYDDNLAYPEDYD